MMPRPATIALFVPALVIHSAAQGQSAPHLQSETLSIRSEILNEEREIWVWTPRDYQYSGVTYPVLYLLDGDVHFQHATGMVQFSSFYLRVPETIVVAVLHPDRGRDLIPTPDTMQVANEPVTVERPRFLRFLTDELRPFIDEHYRTEPFDILAGHSLGGLFAVSAFVEAPDAFRTTIAISPSLYWNDDYILTVARQTLARTSPRSGFLYVALSGGEPPRIAESTRSFVSVLERQGPSRLQWSFEEFPDDNHILVPYEALYRGMRAVFEDWVVPLNGITTRVAEAQTIEPLNAHYRAVSERFGFDARPPELVFSWVGDRLFSDNLPLAIALFRRRITVYPNSPEAHDELARGLEAAGELDEALRSYERAVELARSQDHRSLNAIETRLVRLRARLR